MGPGQRITVSLPPSVVTMAEQVRRAEHRSLSELVREALRLYCRMAVLPVYTPTRRELRSIEAGRAAFQRGDYITLDEHLDEVEAGLDRPRQKSSRAAGDERPKTGNRSAQGNGAQPTQRATSSSLKASWSVSAAE